MKFNPKFGDTIVTNNGRRFTCKPIVRGRAGGCIYGELEGASFDSWQDWDENGIVVGGGEEYAHWNIKEIIPAEGTEPCKITEPDLEFKRRVLQKENEFLTRLLLKEGKL